MYPIYQGESKKSKENVKALNLNEERLSSQQ